MFTELCGGGAWREVEGCQQAEVRQGTRTLAKIGPDTSGAIMQFVGVVDENKNTSGSCMSRKPSFLPKVNVCVFFVS